MLPKIYFKSCKKVDPSLLAWEKFFKNKNIKYKTDKSFRKFSLNKSDLAIFFGSWKQHNNSFHKCRNYISKKYETFLVHETSLIGRKEVTENYNEDWYRIGLNGFLANTGKFNNEKMPSDRWEIIKQKRDIEYLPFNFDGNYILVCLQLPGDTSLQGANISQWLFDICSEIRKKSDLPILIRTPQLERDFDQILIRKTLLLKNISIQKGTRENLFQSLDNAYFVCTYSSGIGIDALIRGKPVVVTSKASFVYESRTKLNDALNFKFNTNNRLQVLSNISYCQWSLDEIELGLPWKHFLNPIFLLTFPY